MVAVLRGRRGLVIGAIVVVLLLVAAASYAILQASAGQVTANLQVITGGAQVERSGSTAFTTATTGTQLASGDSVRTNVDSLAAIHYPDGSLTRLAAASTVQVKTLAKTGAGGYDISVNQTAGKTWNEVKQLVNGSHFTVTAPNSTNAEVRGTTFSVVLSTVNGKPVVTLDVWDGSLSVKVGANGTPVTVSTGQQAVITAGSTSPTVQNIPETDKKDPFTVFNKTQDTIQGPTATIIGPNTINPGETTAIAQGAQADGNSDLDFGLGWGGSSLELCIYAPDLTLYECLIGDIPPLHVVIPDAEAGSWSFTVRAVVLDKPEAWYLIVGATNPSKIPVIPFFSVPKGASAIGCSRDVKAGATDSWSVNARSGSGKPTVTVDGIPVTDKWTQTKYGAFKNDKGDVSLNFAPVLGVDPAAIKVVISATSKSGEKSTFSCTENVIAPQLSVLSGTVNGGGQNFLLTLDDAWGHSTPVLTDLYAKYSFNNERGGDYKLTLTLPGGCTLPLGAPDLVETPHLDGTNPVTQDFLVDCPGTTAPTTTSGPPPQGTFGGRYSFQYTATGGARPYSWRKIAGLLPPGLVLDPTGALHGTPDSTAASIDPTYFFTVQATSATGILGPPLAQSITIQPQPAIVFSPAGSAPPNAPASGFLLFPPPGEVTVPYSQVFGVTGGIAPYTWSVSSGNPATWGLALSPSGTLSGTPTLATGSIDGTFQVRVTDATGAIADGEVDVKIYPAPTYTESYTSNFNASGYVEIDAGGSFYSYLGFQALYSGPGILSVSSGALPGCLTVNVLTVEGTSYVLSGSVPATCTGSFAFTLRLTDTMGGYVDSIPLTMTINPPLTFSPAATSGTVGVLYTWGPVTGGGGHPGNSPKINIYSGLPGGLTATGNTTTSVTVSGYPNAPGDFVAYVYVTDGALPTQSTYLTQAIHIDASSPVITTTALSRPYADQGIVYLGDTLTAAGGLPPYTWTLLTSSTTPTFSPAPPAGLTLSAGVLGGTITASPAAYPFAVKVCDSQATPVCASNTGSPYTLNVNAQPTMALANTPWANGDTSVTYATSNPNAVATISGGTNCYVTATGLPAGMYAYAYGCSVYLYGQPTSAGAYPVSIFDTDYFGVTSNTVMSTLTVVSSTKPVINGSASPPGAVVGQLYSNTIGYATLGSQFNPITHGSSYDWSVSPALPAGLALAFTNAYVSVTGSPAAASAMTTYTLTVKDTLGASNTTPFTFKLGVETSAPSLDQMPPGGDVGIPYSYQFTSTLGGTAPFAWNQITGCLTACTFIAAGPPVYNVMPPGLTLSPAGLLSGTPTAVGSYVFFAQVTDSFGVTNQGPVTIAIASGTVVVTNPTSALHQGQAYSDSFTAGGGTNPYVWKLTAGALPAGLTFDKFGHITGTPTGAAGSGSTFSVQVTDLAGVTATATVTLTVT